MSLEALPVSTSSGVDPEAQPLENPVAEHTRKATQIVSGCCMHSSYFAEQDIIKV